MALKIKVNSFSGQLLLYLFAMEDIVTTLASHPSRWRWERPPVRSKRESNQSTLYRLVKWGLIEIVEKDDAEYYRLTKKGEMEALVLKTKLPHTGPWDGKWRLVIFDIPEGAKKERDQLRRLLLQNDFRKMQASVYVSPYPFNREAIAYLKETGLIRHIRFARVDELDEDEALRKSFNI